MSMLKLFLVIVLGIAYLIFAVVLLVGSSVILTTFWKNFNKAYKKSLLPPVAQPKPTKKLEPKKRNPYDHQVARYEKELDTQRVQLAHYREY